MKNCTLLVLSCDKYSDAWIPFFTLLKRYWGGSIENLKIVLMAESKQFSFDGLNIKTFPTDKKEFWSERLLRYLDLIDTDFVMLACEDSFLRKKNDPDRIQKFISYMENNPDISNINLQGIDEDDLLSREQDNRFPELDKRPHGADYCFNTGGLWRVSHLKNYLIPKESPWDFETTGNFWSKFTKNTFYVEKKGNYSCWPINWTTEWMGICRGKWVYEDVVPLFEKEGIVVDLNRLGTYHRPIAKSKEKKPSLRKKISKIIRNGTLKKAKLFKLNVSAYFQVLRKKMRNEWS